MQKTTPLNKEVPFRIDELFFSTTDSRGVIQFGNEVFINISGYQKDELFQAPHNVIRHPDMPKCIFKIFWDALKAGTPICAYVKNMAKDGAYYWVFAAAFPVDSRFLSIRFKPSSSLFKTVVDLYADVLKKEKASSMLEAEAYLLQKLKDLGFNSYSDFMIHAVITELKSFESQNIETEENNETKSHIVKRISEINTSTGNELDKSFAMVEEFTNSSNKFSENLKFLSVEFRKLSMLSLNMNILATKFGEVSETLSVIATQFSNLAKQIETELQTFTEFTRELLTTVSHCTLDLSALKIQKNMVDFFLKETLRKSTVSESAFEEMAINEEIFTKVFDQSSQKLLSELRNLNSSLTTIDSQLSTMKTSLSGLEIVKQIASIESARNDAVRDAFKTYIDEMSIFIGLLKKVRQELNEEQMKLSSNSKSVIASTEGIKRNIQDLFTLTLNVKNK